MSPSMSHSLVAWHVSRAGGNGETAFITRSFVSGASPDLERSPICAHTHTQSPMPSNANLVSQMLRERHEMPQKCHHSTLVTGSSSPSLPHCKYIPTYAHLHVFVCVMECGTGLLFFSLWVPACAWSSRVVPIIPSLLSSRRPKGPAWSGDISGIL